MAIKRKQRAQQIRAALSVDDVIAETCEVAFSTLNSYIDFSGDDIRPRPGVEISEESIRALQSVKIITRTYTHPDGTVEEVRSAEYKLWDKIRALESLAKYFGMFLEQEDIDRIKSRVEEIRLKMAGRPRNGLIEMDSPRGESEAK